MTRLNARKFMYRIQIEQAISRLAERLGIEPKYIKWRSWESPEHGPHVYIIMAEHDGKAAQELVDLR